jgi:hypothetical protein
VDKETMVDQILTNEMIESGKALIQKMDEKGIQPDAALWLYFPDIQAYKLLIAEIKVGKIGPRDIYKKIQNILSKLPKEKKLSLDDIALAKPNAPIIALLKVALKTDPGISGIRFTNNVINGTVVEDAYIYRLL